MFTVIDSTGKQWMYFSRERAEAAAVKFGVVVSWRR